MRSLNSLLGNHKTTLTALCAVIFISIMLTQAAPRANALTVAPDFTAEDTEGNLFALRDFQGQIVLLEFMQTNSSQSIEQIQYLTTLHNEFNQDLILISMSIDPNDTIDVLRSFRKIHNTTWIYAQSSYDVYTGKYNVTTVPTIYLIDQEGFIQHHNEGIVEDTILRPEIQRLLTSPFTIFTTPSLEQVYFQIDGQDYYTDTNGTIRIDLRLGPHSILLMDTHFTRAGVEYRFSTWSGHASGNANSLSVNISEPISPITLQANYESYDLLPPSADAGLDLLVSVGQLAIFDGSYSSDNVGVSTYTWIFFDESWHTLAGVQATHIFQNPGEYLVTLNVTDAVGFWAIDSLIVVVQDLTAPTANAGKDQRISEDTFLLLNGSASFDDVGIQSYVWSFWDVGPVVLTGMMPNYTFLTPDTYRVTLTVTDTSGNEAVDSVIIVVIDITNPTADAGPDLVTLEDVMILLNGSSSWDENDIVSYTWTFIDHYPITLNGVSTNYTFYNPGEYTITLLVTDIAGNKASDTITIYVLDITDPRANAGQNQVTYIGDLVTFDAGLSTDNGRIISFAWTYGDGGEGISNPSTHIYNAPGQYNVTVVVKDAANNIGSDQITVIVLDRKTLVIDMSWVPLLLILATMNLLIVKRLKRP